MSITSLISSDNNPYTIFDMSSRDIKELEEVLRIHNLKKLCKENIETLADLGITSENIYDALITKIQNIEDRFIVKWSMDSGVQTCPFSNSNPKKVCELLRKNICEITNLQSKEKIVLSSLSIHLIKCHAFFGINTEQLKKVCCILELQPDEGMRNRNRSEKNNEGLKYSGENYAKKIIRNSSDGSIKKSNLSYLEYIKEMNY